MAVVEVEFPSYSLKRSTTFKVLLPIDRGFELGEVTEFATGKFKTLYLLHGYTGAHNDYLYMTDIWHHAGDLGLAVVFPDGENSFYLEDEVLGISHSTFVGKELVDFTRSAFPLSSRREDTFIGGISMGGYGAVVNGLRFPETFSRILSLSGAFIEMDIADASSTIPDGISSEGFQRRVFGDPAALRNSTKDPRYLIEQALSSEIQLPAISQYCGREDFLIGSNRKLHEFMRERGIDHLYEEGAGIHDWDYWRPRLASGLRWLAG